MLIRWVAWSRRLTRARGKSMLPRSVSRRKSVPEGVPDSLDEFDGAHGRESEDTVVVEAQHDTTIGPFNGSKLLSDLLAAGVQKKLAKDVVKVVTDRSYTATLAPEVASKLYWKLRSIPTLLVTASPPFPELDTSPEPEPQDDSVTIIIRHDSSTGKLDTKQLIKNLIDAGLADKVAKDMAKQVKAGECRVKGPPEVGAKMYATLSCVPALLITAEPPFPELEGALRATGDTAATAGGSPDAVVAPEPEQTAAPEHEGTKISAKFDPAAGKVDTKQLAKDLVAAGMREKFAKDVAKKIKDGLYTVEGPTDIMLGMYTKLARVRALLVTADPPYPQSEVAVGGGGDSGEAREQDTVTVRGRGCSIHGVDLYYVYGSIRVPWVSGSAHCEC